MSLCSFVQLAWGSPRGLAQFQFFRSTFALTFVSFHSAHSFSADQGNGSCHSPDPRGSSLAGAAHCLLCLDLVLLLSEEAISLVWIEDLPSWLAFGRIMVWNRLGNECDNFTWIYIILTMRFQTIIDSTLVSPTPFPHRSRDRRLSLRLYAWPTFSGPYGGSLVLIFFIV